MRLRRYPTAAMLMSVGLIALVAFRLSQSSQSSTRDVLLNAVSQTVDRVIDGDTLLLTSGHRVRLIGVDTPETKHPDRPVEERGEEASQFTRTLVGDGPVRLEFDRERRDDYHRLLAYVYLLDGRLLNEELIRAGYSKAETRFPYRSDMKKRFTIAEEEARLHSRGRWQSATLPLRKSDG